MLKLSGSTSQNFSNNSNIQRVEVNNTTNRIVQTAFDFGVIVVLFAIFGIVYTTVEPNIR